MNDFYHRQMPTILLRRMEWIVYNETQDIDKICLKNLNYKAEVIFRIATDTMSVTVSSRRLSFFDKLSGFGK